ncbi:MAG: hypothetical protein V2J42_13335 [Wenzhouxiangella sp.]|nr:hypothetical protein [Wenzhouxiangella sp.]
MAQFVEGELAVLQNASYFQEWDGALAVVVGPLKLRNPRDMHTMQREPLLSYSVLPLVEGAIEVCCQPHQLRKLDGADETTNSTAQGIELASIQIRRLGMAINGGD